ncbi:MAG: hypothetical protein Q4D95_00620 [Peptoniphilus sp.]|nr:hypothetical protein [Peptoniphilus sp.]
MMLYGLNVINDDLLNISLKEDLISFEFKKEDLSELSADDRKKIGTLINCTKALKEKDLIAVKWDDRCFICRVLSPARDEENLTYVAVESHELADFPEDLKDFFEDVLLDKIHNETLEDEIERIFAMFASSEDQSFQMEFIKNNRALVEVKKAERKNKRALKDLQSNRGELVIELNPPKIEEQSLNLPIIYEEEKEEMEEAYLELLKNQIEFCMQIQKLATDQLIKTQRIFNAKFFKKR